MFSRRMFGNIALVVASVVAAFAVAEILVRLFAPVGQVGPTLTVYDPVIGKRLKAGVNIEVINPEFRMRFSTNSLGFRGKEPERPPRGGILFLGDSFTMGYGISDGEEFPSRIAAALSGAQGGTAVPVTNAGIAGSGNGYWVKFLNSKAAELQPRLVVMQVMDNDFDDNVEEKYFGLDSGGVLHEFPVPAPDLLRRLQPFVEAIPGVSDSYLYSLLRQLRQFRGAQSTVRPEAPAARVRNMQPSDQLTFRIVEAAISTCENHGWQMLAITVGLARPHEAAMQEIFARHRVPVVSIPSKRERPELYFKSDGHWNPDGHAYVAGIVLSALRSGGIANQ